MGRLRQAAEGGANLESAEQLLEHYGGPEEKRGLIERLKRHFTRDKKVADQTIERLASLSEEM